MAKIDSKLPRRKLEFTEAMRIGNSAIDDEHGNLVEIINEIVSARDEGRLEDCERLTRTFAASMKEHLRREEKILEEAGFGRLDEHRKHHFEIRKNIEPISQDMIGNIDNEEVWADFYQMLISIVFDDAIKADMDFKSFLTDRAKPI